MKMQEDLRKIKKHYGEKMMHLCKKLFPTILETEGLLYQILTSTFHPTRELYKDIEEKHIEVFKDIINGKLSLDETTKVISTKTPKELLEEAGYILYECNTEDEIQSFKKYYAKGEELCTFSGHRLDKCHVFFAVKKDVDKIKREDFKSPDRQDEYGTSVISIQFSKGKINTLSIKNRYNHSVLNPDATYSNNLENIKEGLTSSFESTYNLNINSNQESYQSIPGYILASDGKHYKFNYEINNTYYCPDNIIIDNSKPIKYDKSTCIVFENFILDLQKKTITKYDNKKYDSFIDTIPKIEKVIVENNNDKKVITINDEIVIVLDKTNSIIEYKNHKIESIGPNFLLANKKLEKIDIPNVKRIGSNFLKSNYHLTKIDLPNVEIINSGFLSYNTHIKEIYLPKVKTIRDNFLFYGRRVETIIAPELIAVGNSFIHTNQNMKRIFLPKLEIIGKRFLFNNEELEEVILPSVREIGDCFLMRNKTLKRIDLPNVEKLGLDFLPDNTDMEIINLPMVMKIKSNFITKAKHIIDINMENLQEIEKPYLISSKDMEEYINNVIRENNIHKQKIKG